jgi:hypothetical protein
MGWERMMHFADVPRHEEVKSLAYKLWEERGAPFGTPKVDWFRAEEELQAAGHDTPLSILAKTIGSALGSVAATINLNS